MVIDLTPDVEAMLRTQQPCQGLKYMNKLNIQALEQIETMSGDLDAKACNILRVD